MAAPTPSSTDLIDAIGDILDDFAPGGVVGYASIGSRDKHYGVWLALMILDEAQKGGLTVELYDLDASGQAVFRGKPSDLGPTYTWACVLGLRRRWEVHVDVNALGVSGERHGVDVSLTDASRARPPVLDLRPHGLGMEAKCFGSSSLDPGHGRLTLGFQLETGATFWLVSNKDNATTDGMLDSSRHPKTRFFSLTAPGSRSETALRRQIAAHLGR